MSTDREYLMRYLDGELAADERRALEARLDDDAGLRAVVERLRVTRESIRGSRSESFALGFSGRVMNRIGVSQTADDAFYGALDWIFKRAAIAGIVVATIFGALNAIEYGKLQATSTVIESILGLPSAGFGEAVLGDAV